MAVKVLIVSVARHKWERSEVGEFKAAAYCCGNARVGKIILATVDKEPTSCARNFTVASAQFSGLSGDDLVFMLDNDHSPNIHFFNHAVNWFAAHPGPAVVASPYCGGEPEYGVQVLGKDDNNVIRRVSRDEAAAREGTGEVVAVGTGVFAANMRAFDLVAEPWFEYGYDSPRHLEAIQTEDFYFTANLTAAGGKVWCAWDHWSLHHKPQGIGKPEKPGKCKEAHQ